MRITILIVLCFLCGILSLTVPGSANPIEITLTNYSIYQNGQPVDNPINFSLRCYGSYNEYRLKAMGLPTNVSTTNNELVYSFSISCEPDNCFREDRNNPTWGMIISSCDLEGIYKGKPFFVKNFTTNPEPECLSLHRWNFSGDIHYYAVSSEDRNYCQGNYRSDEIDSGLPFCYQAHSRPVNKTAIIQFNPSLYCEKRFDIPLNNQTVNESEIITSDTFTPKSPVASLYCSIVEFFGGRCE